MHPSDQKLRAERDAYLRQRDEALGERNEYKRQLDEVMIERDRLRIERPDIAPWPDPPVSSEPSIFVASLPKSGTEFIRGAISDCSALISPREHPHFIAAQMGGYFNRHDTASTGIFTSERLQRDGLARFAGGGCIIATHAGATFHNLSTLVDSGFRKVTILIRDPRDATVSWTHHLRALGPGMRNVNTMVLHIPYDYYAWSIAEQMSYQVRAFLPSAITWIEGWLDASMNDNRLRVHIVEFDAIRTDPMRVLRDIFEFHGVRGDLSRFSPPRPGMRHYREGKSGSWVREFRDADKALADALIGSRLDMVNERLSELGAIT